jgi:hypothetical protein
MQNWSPNRLERWCSASSVCRLDEATGIRIFLRAARQLASEVFDVERVFCSDADVTRPEVEVRIARFGLSDRIRI